MRIIRPVKVTKDGTFTRAGYATYWDRNGVMRVAAPNVLRVTYDPANLKKAPYALIEGASTNLLSGSSQLLAYPWTPENVTGTADAATAPDGTTSAELIIPSGNTPAIHDVMCAVAPITGQPLVISCFVKPLGSMALQMYLGNNLLDQGAAVTFDLKNGVCVPSASSAYADWSISGSGIKAMPNGWFRCWLAVMPGAATRGTFSVAFRSADPTTFSSVHTPDGASGLYLWGAQMENGTLPTSYISATSGPALRGADVVGTTGLIFSNVPEADYPLWSATNVYAQGDRVLDPSSHKVYESITGQVGTATFQSGTTSTVTMKKPDGTVYVPAIGTAVAFSGALPAALVAGTTYYTVTAGAGSFDVSATKGGTVISLTTQATPANVVASSNYGVPIATTSQWLDAGFDNRWDMFDDSVTSQTSQAGDIAISFFAGTRLDSIAAFNLQANYMTVSFTDIATGEVLYSARSNLVDNSVVNNLYAYLYEPIVHATECLIDKISLGISSNCLITLTFSSNGATKVGGVVFGLEKDIGVTEWGSKIGIIDYSVKTKDNFGNYSITPRAFSKRGDFTVQVPTSQVDYLQSLLAQFRATPIVYIGSNSGNRTQFNSTMIYGFYKDFDINIAYNAYSVCSMTVEGLT